MKRIASVAVAAALAASVAAGSGIGGRAAVASPSSVPPSTIAWGSCQQTDLRNAGAQCGFVSVPLDYSNPVGPHIQLAVSRLQHTSPDSSYQGVLLVNPGGPGGSGLDLPLDMAPYVPNGVGDDFDWIGFDPRGVGSSRPSLSCQRNYFHFNRTDYRPSARDVRIWKRRSRSYAAACEQAQPALIAHLTTADNARDMESIRLALGVPTISYYGFSYGTYLGAVYATLFPHHLNRMVLDSNVDPTRVWNRTNLDQDIAFNRNINLWWHWVARYHATYHLGSTTKAVRRTWYAQRAKLAQHPAGGEIGPDEWTDTFLYAAYYRFTWPRLADDFSKFVHRGEWQPVAAEYASDNTPGDDNSFAVYLGTQCTDAPWPSWPTYYRQNVSTAKKAPFETWSNAWYNAPCVWWPVAARRPVSVHGGSVSALLIDETRDAATPFEGSLELRRLFPQSSLIAEPGGMTHADSLSGDRCVDDLVATYLSTGQRPARVSGDGPDYRCRPLPSPTP